MESELEERFREELSKSKEEADKLFNEIYRLIVRLAWLKYNCGLRAGLGGSSGRKLASLISVIEELKIGIVDPALIPKLWDMMEERRDVV